MALSFAQLGVLWNSIFRDDAPAGSLVPSVDLETRLDLLDTLGEMFNNIPAGPAGPQGVAGPVGVAGPAGPVGPAGLEWRGTWAAPTTYALDDAVGYNGASYFCIAPITGNASNTNPVADTARWALLAARGANGLTGATGPQGPAGPQGVQGNTGAAGPQGPAGSTGALTFGTVIKATPAAALVYGINTVTGGSGTVKLPDAAGLAGGFVLYAVAAAASGVESFTGTNAIYYNGTVSQLPRVYMRQGEIWRFVHITSGVWMAEKVNNRVREYAARLNQVTTNAPTAVEFVNEIAVTGIAVDNNLWRSVTYHYVAVGQYSARINTLFGISLSAASLDVAFSDNKARVTGISNGTNGTTMNYLQVDFETRNAAGDLTDGLLSFSTLNLKYYN